MWARVRLFEMLHVARAGAWPFQAVFAGSSRICRRHPLQQIDCQRALGDVVSGADVSGGARGASLSTESVTAPFAPGGIVRKGRKPLERVMFRGGVLPSPVSTSDDLAFLVVVIACSSLVVDVSSLEVSSIPIWSRVGHGRRNRDVARDRAPCSRGAHLQKVVSAMSQGHGFLCAARDVQRKRPRSPAYVPALASLSSRTNPIEPEVVSLQAEHPSGLASGELGFVFDDLDPAGADAKASSSSATKGKAKPGRGTVELQSRLSKARTTGHVLEVISVKVCRGRISGLRNRVAKCS